MTVKDAIVIELEKLSKDEKVVFLGENVINSGRIYGLLDKVPINKCLEMPVAENLIAGSAIGLAIAGFTPVCVFQRMDFMLIAADAIINHACMIPRMTRIKLPIIFLTVKASLNDTFYVGLQHSKDLSHVFEPYLSTWQVPDSSNRVIEFKISEQPILIVVDKECFNNEANCFEKVGGDDYQHFQDAH